MQIKYSAGTINLPMAKTGWECKQSCLSVRAFGFGQVLSNPKCFARCFALALQARLLTLPAENFFALCATAKISLNLKILPQSENRERS